MAWVALPLLAKVTVTRATPEGSPGCRHEDARLAALPSAVAAAEESKAPGVAGVFGSVGVSPIGFSASSLAGDDTCGAGADDSPVVAFATGFGSGFGATTAGLTRGASTFATGDGTTGADVGSADADDGASSSLVAGAVASATAAVWTGAGLVAIADWVVITEEGAVVLSPVRLPRANAPATAAAPNRGNPIHRPLVEVGGRRCGRGERSRYVAGRVCDPRCGFR